MEKAIEKAGALVEALPYIQRFRDKEVIVKFGGAAMEDPRVVDDVVEDVVFLAEVGIRPILVHGGGKAISRAMEESGIEPRFLAGHRVTDERTLSVVVRVLVEEVNAHIIERIRAHGGKAAAAFQHNTSLLRATRKSLTIAGKDGVQEEVDVGCVGDVVSVRADLLRRMAADAIVVVPPIGQDDAGQLYNVNADSAAAAIARDLRAEKIVFLTDVHGIMARPGDAGSFVSSLDRSDVTRLIEQGVINGGMLPKVAACLDATAAGVRKAHIIDGTLEHALLLEIFTDEGVGTEIVDRAAPAG